MRALTYDMICWRRSHEVRLAALEAVAAEAQSGHHYNHAGEHLRECSLCAALDALAALSDQEEAGVVAAPLRRGTVRP